MVYSILLTLAKLPKNHLLAACLHHMVSFNVDFLSCIEIQNSMELSHLQSFSSSNLLTQFSVKEVTQHFLVWNINQYQHEPSFHNKNQTSLFQQVQRKEFALHRGELAMDNDSSLYRVSELESHSQLLVYRSFCR